MDSFWVEFEFFAGLIGAFLFAFLIGHFLKLDKYYEESMRKHWAEMDELKAEESKKEKDENEFTSLDREYLDK